MEQPTIKTTVVNKKSGVKYHVMSYREITREEALTAVRGFNAGNGNKRPARGEEFVIIYSARD